ncbi:MAG TPA: hypothetical protein VFI24_04080 [Pyrinomonadaceae bacterium]|nr:hypothetical protein [Pyrinomonadaceae bacterium]
MIRNDYGKKTLLASSKDGLSLYSLDAVTGDLIVYENNGKPAKKVADSFLNVEALAVGPKHELYLAQKDSTVRMVSSDGRRLNAFHTVYPKSIAVLRNGNVVVASPFNGKNLHLYNGQGVLLASFGDIRPFDSSQTENEFLNEGRVVVGRDDQIYYVSTYAPEPYVLRFSSEGQLLGEFQIEGDAVDLQTGFTREFLNRRIFCNGGVTIITSTTVDPKTGHLWLGMNGLSTQGTVYEYDEGGSKVREYALLLNANNKQHNVTHVKDIAVSSDAVDVSTWFGTYSFKFSDLLIEDAYAVRKKDSGSSKPGWREWANPFAKIKRFWEAPSVPVPAIPQAPCAQAQNYDCVANCPTGSNPQSVNCGAEIASLLGDRIATQASCERKTIDPTPGSTTPGGCSETVQFCNSTNGATGSLTANLNCNAVPTPTPTPTPTPEPTPTPQPTPTPGYCLGVQDFVHFPSSGCITGLFFQGPCTRSAAFRSRCADPTGYQDWSCSCPDGTTMSPIVIDVDHSGFSMSDAAGGVVFNMLNDGVPLGISWTAAGSTNALLVLDRNGNGTIDNGTELFGDLTPQPLSTEANGFLALAEYDKSSNGGNRNGRIDSRDAIFSQLRLWQDANHNGISEANELQTLGAFGITGVDLNYKASKRTDAFGNKFRYRSKIYDASGVHSGRWAWDVFVMVQ